MAETAKTPTKKAKSVRKTRTPRKKKAPIDVMPSSEDSESKVDRQGPQISDHSGSTESPPLEKAFALEADFDQPVPASAASCEKSSLEVAVSNSLRKKLERQAAEEGIELQDFISELLAESVVLRAWEIVERKNQMRGSGNSQSGNRNNYNGNGNNNSGRNGNRGGKGRSGMSHGRYQSIMDDKATFLEYVRNQERSRK
ncbi:MAG: hypothetical protein HRU19_21565 [Pseudobacteriovorax sp.]|nr:hypothetical protein [Pseudobacteriovorax sp.]